MRTRMAWRLKFPALCQTAPASSRHIHTLCDQRTTIDRFVPWKIPEKKQYGNVIFPATDQVMTYIHAAIEMEHPWVPSRCSNL